MSHQDLLDLERKDLSTLQFYWGLFSLHHLDIKSDGLNQVCSDPGLENNCVPWISLTAELLPASPVCPWVNFSICWHKEFSKPSVPVLPALSSAQEEISLSVHCISNAADDARSLHHHHLPFLASVCLLVEFIVCHGAAPCWGQVILS